MQFYEEEKYLFEGKSYHIRKNELFKKGRLLK